MTIQPIVRFCDTHNVVLCLPYQIQLSIGVLKCVPGALSDGASVPAVIDGLPGYEHFRGDTFPAAFVHDQLYAGELCSRSDADEILKSLLLQNGVSVERANCFYWAVRAFGELVWKEHTPASIANARLYAELIS